MLRISQTELEQLTGKRSKLDKLPLGAGRNQSKLHTELVKSCYEWLKLNGILCFKSNVGAMRIGKRFVRFSEPGHPDIYGALPTGTLFGLEIKTGTGRQSREQYQMEIRFLRSRALYLVIRSISELEKWFDEYK